MKAGRTLFAMCALGVMSVAAAVDYPEERGVVPSVIPPSPDEAGIVRNPAKWREIPVSPADQANIDGYFLRYDANRDGVVSLDEARADPELMRVFGRADTDNNGVLTPDEFRTAAVLAASERGAGRRG